MESTSKVSPFRMMVFFFLPCDHGLDFDISLYCYVRIQSINQGLIVDDDRTDSHASYALLLFETHGGAGVFILETAKKPWEEW